jgi:hypothetical protein
MTNILILVVLLVVVSLAKKIVGAKAAPRTITLERGAPKWKNQPAVDALVKPLLAEGFRDVGSWLVKEMNLPIRALAQPNEQVYAVAYDQIRPTIPPFLDLVTRYEDGTSITYNNTTHTAGTVLDKPPGHEKVNAPGADPVTLYHRMLGERPRKPMLAARAQDFKARFEQAYADEMRWRAGRGGPTKDEIRRVAAASGRTVTDAEVDRAQQALKRQAEKARGGGPPPGVQPR